MKKVYLLIAIMVFGIGMAFAQTPPSIDSVWFWEETDCNDSNIVHICYILSDPEGDPASISVQMSADSGATWTVPLVTLIGADDAIGDSIYPGTHCFQWIMSEDMPGVEGYDWMVEVGVPTLLDTFAIIDSISVSYAYGWGLAYGDGHYFIYNLSTGYVYKKRHIHPDSSSVAQRHIGSSYNMDIDYHNGYIYYCTNRNSYTSDDSLKRMDFSTGSVEQLFFSPTIPNIQGVQVVGSDLIASDDTPDPFGVGIWTLYRFDLEGVIPSSNIDTLITEPMDSTNNLEGMAYALGYLWGCNNFGRITQIDPITYEKINSYPVPNIGNGAEGLCWDGRYMWYQNNATRKIYQIMILDSTASFMRAYGSLDSRPPDVAISCPTSSVIAGDSHAFDWIVDDLFFDDDPCSLHFFSGPCGIDERYTATGGSFSWSVPMVDCVACTLIIAARDSFCNWGYDTCVFEIEIANLPPSIDSVWFWEETDCNDSNIVHICYILSDPEGDPASVSVQMSADSGATWTVPLVTLIGAESAIGDSIYPGTHCFEWIMSEDWIDNEDSFYQINIYAYVGTFDVFNIVDTIELFDDIGRSSDGYPSGLTYLGDGVLAFSEFDFYDYAGDNNSIYLWSIPGDSIIRELDDPAYPAPNGWKDLAYDGNYIYGCDYEHGFTPKVRKIDITTGAVVSISVNPLNSLAGIVYNPSEAVMLISGIGPGSVLSRPWYLAKLDTTDLSIIDTLHIEIFDDHHPEGLTYALGKIWIVGDNSGNFGWLDFEHIHGDTIPVVYVASFPTSVGDAPAEGLAWDGTYFYFANQVEHRIYVMLPFLSYDTENSSIAPLDSRPPTVAICCPTDTVFAGDTVDFHWTIDDLFWANDECTLFVGYCDGVDTILLSDTLYSWVAPGVMCDSAWVRIAVRDSFCNWGDDSCSFTIFGDLEPVVVVSSFPWESAYSACDTLDIWWLLHDGSGIDTLTAVVSINEDTLTYPDPLLSWNGDTLFYELITSMFPDTITACLLECDDIWGNPLSAPPYCMTFFNDLGAPIVLGYGPEMTGDLSPTIWACVVDSGSGVDSSRVVFTIDGTAYSYGDGGFSWSGDSFYFDCAIGGLSFSVGDTIEVCVNASDNPDLCNANMTDTCWSIIFADTSAPVVAVIEPPDSCVSACDDEAVVWLFSDIGLGIDTSSVIVTIDGDTANIGLVWSNDTLTFVPDTNWAEGTHVACVVAGADLWGLELIDDSTCVTFDIDLTPPEISILYPTCGATIGDTLADIIALIEDIPAGVWWQSAFIAIESDTFWFDSLYHSGDSLIFRPEDFGLTYSDGETILFCIGAADSADFCAGDNFADTCCTFYIDASGPWATLISPSDGVISSCEYQSVIWRLYGEPLDGTIRVDVNGTIYDLTDSELSRNIDTLIFTPTSPWSSGDNVTACLVEMEDIYGNPLSDTVCVDFTIDLDPPEFSGLYPAPGEIIDNPSPIISLFVEDLIAGLDMDSLILTVNGGTVSFVFDAGTLSFDCSGTYTFGGGDTVEICAHAADLAELCGANSDDTCWTFYIATGGPVVTPIYPNPMAISACDDQGAIFLFDDPQGIDETTIWATIDGATVDFWTFYGDTLNIQPTSSYFADGDTVTVCAGGNDMLDNPPDSVSCITYIIDLSPPVYSNFGPACDDTVQNLLPNISVDVYDSIAGVNAASVWMTINGDAVSATFDGATVIWSPDSNFFPNQWIEICIGASDSPDLCDPNESDSCCSFYILAYPDLWPENLGFEPSSPVEEGAEITFFGLVFNDLIQDVEDFTVCVLQDGMNIGTIPISGLLLGESDSVGWPLSLPAGEYQLCLFADCDSTIIESNETNNIACIDLVVLGALCDVHPNPFTPNADGSNDEAIFEYPGQGNSNATIKIFDMQNRFIKEIPDNIRVWDGTDSGGNKMPRGVYLYLVLNEDKVLCKGTVYLGR